jgi:hypothetical protein
VRFLIEPAVALKVSRGAARPLRADQDSTLHPALRSVVDGQPEFASWTPSSLCFFYVDTVRVGGRTIAEKNVRKSQMMAVWTLSTTEQGRGTRRNLVLDFSTGSARIIRAAEAVKLPLREASFRVSKLPGGPDEVDELYEARLGKARLVWSGHPAGDSTRVEQPIQELWALKGASGTSWNVVMSMRPRWSRPLVGALRVEGKDDLARALKASPIRFVGPRYTGGSADLTFSR